MLMLKKYRYIILAVIGVILLLYWLIEGGSVDENPVKPAKQPNTIINDANLSEEKDGKRLWEIKAKKIEIENDVAGINKMTDVKGTLYREDGTKIDVTSEGGEYVPTSKEVTLTGNVVVVYSEGWVLKSQILNWNPATNMITASDKASFEKDDVYAEGDKMETDKEAAKVKITGNATVIKRR